MIYYVSTEINSTRETNIKNRTFYVSDYMINIKNFDPNNIKTDEKSCKANLIYYIDYLTPKNLKNLGLIINKVNGYIEECNASKYLTLVPKDEKIHWKTMKSYGTKSTNLIRSITNNSENCGKKYMRIRFMSDDDLPLEKTLQLGNVTIVDQSDFHDGSRYYHKYFSMSFITN